MVWAAGRERRCPTARTIFSDAPHATRQSRLHPRAANGGAVRTFRWLRSCLSGFRPRCSWSGSANGFIGRASDIFRSPQAWLASESYSEPTSRYGSSETPIRGERSHKLDIGDPGRTRTSDLQLRRLLLYPTELRGHGPSISGRTRSGAERNIFRRAVVARVRDRHKIASRRRPGPAPLTRAARSSRTGRTCNPRPGRGRPRRSRRRWSCPTRRE